ncbi:MAG: hypothetical protein KGJ34_01785 [Patescibacteria group bacterium]|nr:hypothetical protein [Patescibacteria group bacterium]
MAIYSQYLNLDLQTILIIISIVLNTILGILIFTKRHDEYANRVYIFNIFCIIWWSVMIVLYRLSLTHLLAYTMGLYVAPTFIASSFLYFSFLFPEIHPRIPFRRWYLWAIGALNIVVVCLTLIPGVILESVDYVPGQEKIIHFGFLYTIYAFYISSFFGLGLLILAIKLWLLDDRVKRRQLAYLLWGYLIASTLAMGTNLVLPYFGYFVLNWLGQVLTVFMVLPVTYAIFKHRLFDVKVIATELITISLWLFLLIRLLLDVTAYERLLDAILLGVMFIIGILLIKSVDKEVAQRELIENQEKELEEANARQENLIHFISHEVKGYLAKSEAGFASITEGDYGDVPGDLKTMAGRALEETRRGVDTVMEILSAGDLKKGTINFTMQPFDLRASIERITSELKPSADAKHLSLETQIDGSANYAVIGDEIQFSKHVILNLIDNAIKYTLSGAVRVSLFRRGSTLIFSITDSGVGLTPEDKGRLFTEGGRGKDSLKLNAHSTGYGLFIAKSIVDAHHGRIYAESEGAGKGSTFTVELPAKTS